MTTGLESVLLNRAGAGSRSSFSYRFVFVRFALLGEIEAKAGDGQPIALGPPQQRAVLATLLLEPNRVIPASRLIEAVWDRPPPSALKALHGYVHRLRGVLRADPGLRLRTTKTGYLLEVDPERIDLHQYRRLVDEAAGATDGTKAVLLATALRLWRGEALAQAGSCLLRSVAAQLDEERLSATDAWLAARVRLGQHAECAAELTRLLCAHPLRETTRATLMLALYRSGRRADALAVYRVGRKLLSEEVGIELGAELADLHERMLRDDPGLLDRAAREPARAEPGHAGGPRAGAQAPAEFPFDITGFVGRSGTLAELDACLAAAAEPGPVRPALVVVDGPGGVGKTALVVHWACQVRFRFPGGQLFIDLRGHDPHRRPLSPAEALAQLVRACGIASTEIPAGMDKLRHLYRSLLADGGRLLILDNAASAEQVRPLLPGCPGGMTIITSRFFLAALVATEDAHRIAVDPLSTSASVALLGAVAGRHRITAEPDAAAGVAARCGHLPLALRIAGVRLVAQPESSVASLLADLAADPLAELALDQGTAMRSTLGLSYRTLSTPAQRLLMLLGAFPGPDFSPQAVAALAAEPADVTGRLLAEYSMANLTDDHGAGRLRMHDLVRYFAAGLAARADPDAVRDALRRVFDWYLATVRQAATAAGLPVFLVPPGTRPAAEGCFPDERAALDWLEDERASMVALIRAAASRDAATYPAARQLAIELRGFFRLRRYTTDWLDVAGAGVRLGQRAGSGAEQACSWHSLGHAHWSVGAYQRAITCYQAALAASRASGWDEGTAASLSALGAVYHELGRSAEAIDCYQRTLTVGEPVTPMLKLITIGSLGLAYQTTGKLARAIECFTEAGQLAGQLGAADAEATTLGNLGETHVLLGEYEQARTELDRALKRYCEAGSRNGEANVLTGLARLNVETGCHDAAAYQSVLALRIAQDIGDRRIECDALTASGVVLARKGEFRAARRRLAEASQAAEATGYGRGVGPALAETAGVMLRLGEPRDAVVTGERALSAARQTGDRVTEVTALTVLAQAFLVLSRYDVARSHIEAAVRGCTEMGLAAAQIRARRVQKEIAEVVTGSGPQAYGQLREKRRYNGDGAPITRKGTLSASPGSLASNLRRRLTMSEHREYLLPDTEDAQELGRAVEVGQRDQADPGYFRACLASVPAGPPRTTMG